MAYTIDWTNKSGDTKLSFYRNILHQDKIEIVAKVFIKRVDKKFVKVGLIPEENMKVEVENVNELMQGIQKKTFKMTELSNAQKLAITDNLSDREITLKGWLPASGAFTKLTIHALH